MTRLFRDRDYFAGCLVGAGFHEQHALPFARDQVKSWLLVLVVLREVMPVIEQRFIRSLVQWLFRRSLRGCLKSIFPDIQFDSSIEAELRSIFGKRLKKLNPSL